MQTHKKWGIFFEFGDWNDRAAGPAWEYTIAYRVPQESDPEARKIVCGSCYAGNGGEALKTGGCFRCELCGGLFGRPAAHNAAIAITSAGEA